MSSLSGAGWWQRPGAEHAPLLGDGAVERVVGLIQEAGPFVQGPSVRHRLDGVQVEAFFPPQPVRPSRSFFSSIRRTDKETNITAEASAEEPAH